MSLEKIVNQQKQLCRERLRYILIHIFKCSDTVTIKNAIEELEESKCEH